MLDDAAEDSFGRDMARKNRDFLEFIEQHDNMTIFGGESLGEGENLGQGFCRNPLKVAPLGKILLLSQKITEKFASEFMRVV